MDRGERAARAIFKAVEWLFVGAMYAIVAAITIKHGLLLGAGAFACYLIGGFNLSLGKVVSWMADYAAHVTAQQQAEIERLRAGLRLCIGRKAGIPFTEIPDAEVEAYCAEAERLLAEGGNK